MPEQNEQSKVLSQMAEMLELTALLRASATGDQSAFAKLYDRTSDLLFSLAFRMLNNESDAEEVLMDVYMKAWQNANAYDGNRGSVLAWLVTMTRTTSIDRIRYRKVPGRTTDPLPSDYSRTVSTSDTPEDATLLREAQQKVRHAIDQLPPEQREALELAFFSDLSHSEVAERLGLPLGTLKSRIRLGLQRLKGLLGESNQPGTGNTFQQRASEA